MITKVFKWGCLDVFYTVQRSILRSSIYFMQILVLLQKCALKKNCKMCYQMVLVSCTCSSVLRVNLNLDQWHGITSTNSSRFPAGYTSYSLISVPSSADLGLLPGKLNLWKAFQSGSVLVCFQTNTGADPDELYESWHTGGDESVRLVKLMLTHTTCYTNSEE